MKIAAVIAEYNPFHWGHKYQLDCIKEQCDGVVAIMSGGFVQRGEPAVRDKWTRARSALLNGVDLVIELPCEYAVNTAEKFARGGVEIADAAGVVDCLVFGSESGDIGALVGAAKLLNNEPPEVSEKIREGLFSGMSYPAARKRAYEGKIARELISEPNNILATEYIRALLRLNSEIVPKTIRRIGAGYNDTACSAPVASAAAIRERMREGADYAGLLPHNVWELSEMSEAPDIEALVPLLKYTVLSRGAEYIAEINDVTEGLENKIIAAVREKNSFYEIAGAIKSKRYTMSRIKRILISMLLDIKKEYHAPEYIRILGMNGMGRQILREMKKKARLPIVIKAADFSSPMLKKDITATDVAYLCTEKRTAGMDYLTSPVIAT